MLPALVELQQLARKGEDRPDGGHRAALPRAARRGALRPARRSPGVDKSRCGAGAGGTAGFAAGRGRDVDGSARRHREFMASRGCSPIPNAIGRPRPPREPRRRKSNERNEPPRAWPFVDRLIVMTPILLLAGLGLAFAAVSVTTRSLRERIRYRQPLNKRLSTLTY